MGVDEWHGVYSTKFDNRYLVNGVDPLKPLDDHKVGKGGVYVRDKIVLGRPDLLDRTLINVHKHPWARCVNHVKTMFINVDGLVFPCPWFNNIYQENEFVKKHKDKLTVKKRSLVEVLEDPIWDEFLDILNSNPLDICNIKCKSCQ